LRSRARLDARRRTWRHEGVPCTGQADGTMRQHGAACSSRAAAMRRPRCDVGARTPNRARGRAQQRAGSAPRRSHDMHSRFIPHRDKGELRCDRTFSSRAARENSCPRVTAKGSARTMHTRSSLIVVERPAASCRSTSGSVHRGGQWNTRSDRVHRAMSSHRTGDRHIAPDERPTSTRRVPDDATYRPIRGSGLQYQLISDAICCELQSLQRSRTPIVGVQICHPTSRRRGRVAGPS
jgi:hypothetical protein